MLKRLLTFFLLSISSLTFAAADANKATEAELTQIKGIGPAIAARIVQAREKSQFKSWDDLISRVNGIADTSAQKFSEAGLTVNGQPLPKNKLPDSSKEPKPIEKTGKSANPS